MNGLVTDFDVVFVARSSVELENFLLSFDSDNTLYVMDFSSKEDYLVNQRLLKRCGVAHKHVRTNMNNPDSFTVFKSLLNSDVLQSDYIVFCDGVQLFEDTLTASAAELSDKHCFALSPLSVNYSGEFKEFTDFNENCFFIERDKAKKILKNNMVSTYEKFVSAAKMYKYAFHVSNSMVFE